MLLFAHSDELQTRRHAVTVVSGCAAESRVPYGSSKQQKQSKCRAAFRDGRGVKHEGCLLRLLAERRVIFTTYLDCFQLFLSAVQLYYLAHPSIFGWEMLCCSESAPFFFFFFIQPGHRAGTNPPFTPRNLIWSEGRGGFISSLPFLTLSFWFWWFLFPFLLFPLRLFFSTLSCFNLVSH